MNENQIIEAVGRAFSSRGYNTISRCRTTQPGIDLCVQDASGKEWLIEAKGGTSADPKSPNFGLPFDSAQIAVHVARAIQQAMALRAEHQEAGVAIALPDERYHRKNIEAVGDCLGRLGISVIWVAENDPVQLPADA